MDLTLTRLYQGDDCIIGVLMHDKHFLCFTLENPWLSNAVDISCIPEGHYSCSPHNGSKYKEVWKLSDVENRSNILIHWGNVERHTQGCILVGDKIGSLSGEKAVLNSRMTINILRDYIGINNHFNLTIKSL